MNAGEMRTHLITMAEAENTIIQSAINRLLTQGFIDEPDRPERVIFALLRKRIGENQELINKLVIDKREGA